jgi:hypothetical protein
LSRKVVVRLDIFDRDGAWLPSGATRFSYSY